jgi:hypothetical protein
MASYTVALKINAPEWAKIKNKNKNIWNCHTETMKK